MKRERIAVRPPNVESDAMKLFLPHGLGLVLAVGMCACRTGPPQRPPPAPAAPGSTAAAPASAAPVREFVVRGVVREVRSDRREAVIRHEEIPGYMPPMTMSLEVKDPAELAGVSPGDTVQFRMNVTETEGWIDQIQVLARGMPEDPRPEVPSVRVVRQVEELNEGDELPDYAFITESRRRIRLREFRGRALGLTFIYTRCPYPTFCPRQTRQFVEAAERLRARLPGEPPRWHLLAISFDPAHDTPAVLHRYAQQYGADLSRLNFCTGEMIDLDAITEQFGMIFARDGEGFSHNVRTVVVGADGRIRKIFVGNQWTTDEFVAEMVRAAAPGGPPAVK